MRTAYVRGEDEEHVVHEAQFLQLGRDVAYRFVHHRHHACMRTHIYTLYSVVVNDDGGGGGDDEESDDDDDNGGGGGGGDGDDDDDGGG